ncbi:MAG: hypothetical protein AB8B56_01170 [Crocinitomicaceae bacterium]
MKRALLTSILILFSQFMLFAQSPTSIQCTMNVEQICEDQPYHIDHPKQEETIVIATSLITEISAVYDLINQGNTSNISANIASVQALVDQATVLGMNYAMFQQDLDFIQSIN